jgi:hypothetical protein
LLGQNRELKGKFQLYVKFIEQFLPKSQFPASKFQQLLSSKPPMDHAENAAKMNEVSKNKLSESATSSNSIKNIKKRRSNSYSPSNKVEKISTSQQSKSSDTKKIRNRRSNKNFTLESNISISTWYI